MLEVQEKEKRSSMNVREKLRGAAAEIGNSILTAYFLVMMLVYPFYLKNGYQEIGDVKYFFFRKISFVTGFLRLCITVVIFLLKRENLSITACYMRLSITDWFVYR